MNKLISSFFQVIKGLVILFVLFSMSFYAVLYYQLNKDPYNSIDYEDRDVRLVLNWLEITSNEADIIHSYHPTRNWSGDYTKLFVMHIPTIKESEILHKQGVRRGDKLKPTVKNAVEFISNLSDQSITPWFPNKEQILSKNFYVHSIKRIDHSDSEHILLIQVETKHVYFAAIKM
jgi:hypothetical protein